MSNCIVVDCSYILSDLLPDEQGNTNELSSQIVYVPSIFYLECSNVLLNALKKKRITEEHYDAYLDILSQLPFKVDDFCSTSESLYPIRKLCRKFDLTTYDASYLELTLRLDAKLATHDQKLISISKQNKILIFK